MGKKKKCFICSKSITGHVYKSKYTSNFGRANEDLVPNKEVKFFAEFLFCSFKHLGEFDQQFLIFWDGFKTANQKSITDFITKEDKS